MIWIEWLLIEKPGKMSHKHARKPYPASPTSPNRPFFGRFGEEENSREQVLHVIRSNVPTCTLSNEVNFIVRSWTEAIMGIVSETSPSLLPDDPVIARAVWDSGPFLTPPKLFALWFHCNKEALQNLIPSNTPLNPVSDFAILV